MVQGVMGQAVGSQVVGYREGVMGQDLKMKIQKGYEQMDKRTNKLSVLVTS